MRIPSAQNRADDSQGMESSTLGDAVYLRQMRMDLDGGSGHAAVRRAEPVEIWRARSFIGEHAGEELSLARVAKAVHISPNYLSEKFKEVTGINFVTYIARTRYEKARTLLHNSDLRVSEAAFAAGFQSLSQFNRVFKKFCGKSPSEYRAMTRAKANEPARTLVISAPAFVRRNA
jgi:AraC-like DNA-binding protein